MPILRNSLGLNYLLALSLFLPALYTISHLVVSAAASCQLAPPLDIDLAVSLAGSAKTAQHYTSPKEALGGSVAHRI